MRSIPSTTSTSIAPSPSLTWHSPVPYLFGGLAAMLGLITFALLILACSYWKLSGLLQNQENGEKQSDSANKDSVKVFEEKILVIMAGDEKPTFLATPKASSVTRGFPNHSDQNLENHVTSHKPRKQTENHLQLLPQQTLQPQ